MKIELPAQAAALMARLEENGCPTYAVGGCIRDTLLGRTPGDWDLCTAARPEQMRAIFAGEQLILTGEKHGTVTVVRHGVPYEITTFRVDGGYADHRHPEQVKFVPRVEEDLARRDFTVNAMAYRPAEGLVDVFGGQADLAARCIRCVGEPTARFEEDALRILRALRFAAQLDFTPEPATAAAALALRDTVGSVSAERCYAELDKLLAGPAAGRVLAEQGAVLGGVLPEVLPCLGCGQPGRWHCYDVWQHTAAAVGALGGQELSRAVRWATLLHDMAKPLCKTEDAAGNAHFSGHNQRGARMAREILRRLRAPRRLENEVSELVAVHDALLPQEDPGILRRLNADGPVFLHELCRLKYADLAAHRQQPGVEERGAQVRRFEARMTELTAAGCWRMASLAVSGEDLLAAGVPAGPQVGLTLGHLLNAVMDGALPNERAALLAEALRG